MMSRFVLTSLVLLIAATAPVCAAENGSNRSDMKGAVGLNGTKVPQNPKLPDLNLNNQQREQIRKAVLGRNSEVEFQLKSTKPAKNFEPSVGAKLPKGVQGHSLPSEVLEQLPQLRDYKYVTMKDQVLIVNGMTKTIVDAFSEAQPLI